MHWYSISIWPKFQYSCADPQIQYLVPHTGLSVVFFSLQCQLLRGLKSGSQGFLEDLFCNKKAVEELFWTLMCLFSLTAQCINEACTLQQFSYFFERVICWHFFVLICLLKWLKMTRFVLWLYSDCMSPCHPESCATLWDTFQFIEYFIETQPWEKCIVERFQHRWMHNIWLYEDDNYRYWNKT